MHLARDYTVPACDRDTLVIASSFSGNTEETIAGLLSAETRGSTKLVLSTGGRITQIAGAADAAVMMYKCDGPPRTAWEYGFLPVLALLQRLGVVSDYDRLAPLALDALVEQSACLEATASHLAPLLVKRIPFIVGTEHLAPVARRWASQLNENSKRVAFFGELPELNHNFLLGLTDDHAGAVTIVLLDAELLSERGRARLDLTERLLQRHGVSYERVLISGASELDSMLQGALLGDWVSWRLATTAGVDPSDTTALEDFKAALTANPVGVSAGSPRRA